VENSLGAFVRGIEQHVDVLELDLRRTLDGVMVVNHDPRILPGTPKIAKTLFADLPKLADGQSVATLDQVAALAHARGAKLAIELKETGAEQQVVDILRGAGLATDSYELISFSPKALKAVKAIDPSIRSGLLAPRIPGFLRESALYPAAIWMLERLDWQPALNRAARAGADYVSVDHRMLTPKFLAAARQRGIPFDVWTANTTPQIQRALDAGAQGIVTDHPLVAMRMRDAHQPITTAAHQLTA
jgi:glycerophosphoryl diester phosphodiesterase